MIVSGLDDSSLPQVPISHSEWQICIVIGGDFHWNIHNPVQKTDAKIIDMKDSALFYFISSRELH
jgi:hypothetical protein